MGRLAFTHAKTRPAILPARAHPYHWCTATLHLSHPAISEALPQCPLEEEMWPRTVKGQIEPLPFPRTTVPLVKQTSFLAAGT